MINMGIDNKLVRNILFSLQGNLGTDEEQKRLEEILNFSFDDHTGMDVLNSLCKSRDIDYDDSYYIDEEFIDLLDDEDVPVSLSKDPDNIMRFKILSDLEIWYYKNVNIDNKEKVKFLFRLVELKDGFYRFSTIYNIIERFKNENIDNVFLKKLDTVEFGNKILVKLMSKKQTKKVTLNSIREMLSIHFKYLNLSDTGFIKDLDLYTLEKDGIMGIDLLIKLINNKYRRFNKDFIFYTVFLCWANINGTCDPEFVYTYVNLERSVSKRKRLDKYIEENRYSSPYNVIKVDDTHYLVRNYR